MSRWLIASASAGTSRSVGISDFESLIEPGGGSVCGGGGRGGGFLGLLLGDELLDFLPHHLDDLVLRDFPDDLAPPEDQADAAPARDADVRGARFARPVDLAPHHGDVHFFLHVLQALLALLRQLDEVHVGAPARWARDERETALTEAERLE